jgi:hypothetical protein
MKVKELLRVLIKFNYYFVNAILTLINNWASLINIIFKRLHNILGIVLIDIKTFLNLLQAHAIGKRGEKKG